MELRRREFIAGFGVALASFLTLGCRARPPIVTCYAIVPSTTPPTPVPPETPVVTCYVPVEPTPVQTPMVTCYTVVPAVTVTPTVMAQGREEWQYLRSLWLGLDELAAVAGDQERGEKERDLLIGEHEAALAGLVAIGSLDAAVAEEMQVAYGEAAYHVWRSNCGMTCYEPLPYPDYDVAGRAGLLGQAAVLEEMAGRAALDADTVNEARAAIERDLAYLTLSADDQRDLIDRIVEEAGEGGDYPELTELDLAVPPATAEAARVLVQLLLGKQ